MVKLDGERFRRFRERMKGFAERKAEEAERKELGKILHKPAERQERRAEIERLEREAKELKEIVKLQKLRAGVKEARRVIGPQRVSGARQVFGGLARVGEYGQRMFASPPAKPGPAQPRPLIGLGSLPERAPTIGLGGAPKGPIITLWPERRKKRR